MYHKLSYFLIGCLLVLSATALTAQNQTLFEWAGDRPLTEEQQRYLKQIQQLPNAGEPRIVSPDLTILKSEKTFTVDFFDDWSAEVSRDKVVERNYGSISWQGHCEKQYGQVLLVIRDGHLTGSFRLTDRRYAVYPLGGDLHVLVRDLADNYPEDHPRGAYPALEDKARRPAPAPPSPSTRDRDFDEKEPYLFLESSEKDYCRIRLLIAITDSIHQFRMDPISAIQLATDEMNLVNANSGVPHEVELAGIVRVNYLETFDLDDDLDAFRDNGDGAMDEIHDLRDLYDADLCQLLVNSAGDGCGLADDIGASYGTGFCVTAYNCMVTNLTYTHEFGHLYGNRHDWYVDGTSGSNHGYVNLPDLWRTVMAYNNECDCSDEASPCPDTDDRATPSSPSCSRLQYWSNPGVFISGDATGIVDSSENYAQMNTYEPTIRGFQSIPAFKVIWDDVTVRDNELADFLGLTTLRNQASLPVEYQNGSAGSFRAGEEILITENFSALNGTDFVAWLYTCQDVSPPWGESKVAGSGHTKYLEPGSEPGPDSGLQIFPNPAYSEATIRYELPETSFVNLSLYSLNGRPVRKLIYVPVHPAGRFEHTVPVGDLPPGVYLCRLTVEEGTRVVRLVVNR